MLANRRLRQEEMLGQAIASQRAYRNNTLNSFGSDLTTAGTYGLMSGNSPFGKLQFGEKRRLEKLKREVKFKPPTEYQESDLTGLED
jgi:hypothetical protein